MLDRVMRGAGAFALWMGLGLTACSGASEEAKKPTALLSPSLRAETAYRRLLADWSRASRAERLRMEIPIEELKKKYPTDPLVRQADALLSWIALEQGDLALALARARLVEKGVGTGTVGDIAHTVQGAALRRQGKPREALDLLAPLVSKLIDGWARSLFNAEIVESALQAGEWDYALGLMSIWQREAGLEERATVRAQIERNLERVPGLELSLWMRRPRGIEVASVAEEELEIRRLVAQRLATVARADKDAELAHQLLSIAGNLLGDQSDAVAQLAAGANRARVEARTVGLLLSLRNDKTRRRGADVAEGIAFGLGLPGSAARLVSRDDKGSPDRIEEALAALSADGASILIAGSDTQEATVAAMFAESRQIPVILLRPPARSARSDKARFTFVIGLDPDDIESALITALTARGASPLALLVDEPIPPRAPRPEIAHVRGCREAAASWKPLGVGGILLEAQPDCVRAAVVSSAPLRLKLAAGFESDPAGLPSGSVAASAGLYPIALGSKPRALEGWLKTHASPPGFWTALGRDAAVLAWAGVQSLPPRGTEDPQEVTARRALATSSLENAQADLWTTEAKGFAGARTLPRTVTVREISR
ncbi:Hypothetical protein A7982_09265 [Minicystis rosea]|nr:Hypothetical protein A7982_09265 [Minicystis rosea]